MVAKLYLKFVNGVGLKPWPPSHRNAFCTAKNLHADVFSEHRLHPQVCQVGAQTQRSLRDKPHTKRWEKWRVPPLLSFVSGAVTKP